MCIALGDNSDVFLVSFLRDLKGEFDKSGHGMAGENADFGRNLPRLAFVTATSLACVFALAIFADDDPVEVAGCCFAERRLYAVEDLCRTDVCVLLEPLADSQTKTPERNVIGYICVSSSVLMYLTT